MQRVFFSSDVASVYKMLCHNILLLFLLKGRKKNVLFLLNKGNVKLTLKPFMKTAWDLCISQGGVKAVCLRGYLIATYNFRSLQIFFFSFSIT